ncbi:uncharacterized protein LOC143599375 [Bidens hawaiensis]|uniref:uncharacterized protein LOC143599375 n=1 Tax=Bidens hawaiensis TaxID=980011 RepID=UPI004049D0F0
MVGNNEELPKTSEVTINLKESFLKQCAPRAYELKQTLTAMRQDGISVYTYFEKLKVLWDELQLALPSPKCICNGCSCNMGKKLVDLKEKERLYEFLLGLDGEFGTIRAQILAMSPTPNLLVAYHLVSEDEQYRINRMPNNDASAFYISASSKRDNNNRGGMNPLKEKKVIEKEKLETVACVEAEGNPLSGLTSYKQFVKFFTGEPKDKIEPAANMAHTSSTTNSTGSIGHESSWVVDSGATDHITYDASVLESIVQTNHEFPVTIPNGERVKVEGKGDYTFSNGTKINNVLHVPDFSCNLLSVSKICNDNQCAVTFFPDFFVMHGLRSRTLIGSGRCKDGLYRMGMMDGRRRAMIASMDTWHKHLGHTSDSKLCHVDFLKDCLKNRTSFCDS